MYGTYIQYSSMEHQIQIQNQKGEDTKREPALYYITLATKPHRVLDRLQERIPEIIVLGKEEDRQIGWEGSQNFGLKLKTVSDFVNRHPMYPHDIVLFTDAYDVACCGSLSELLKRFKTFHKPIVFGAETFCNPDPQMAAKYKNTHDYEFPYLNSGFFIGYVWALQYCISAYEYNDGDDDQRYWTKQYLENNDLIELDYFNRMVLNTAGMDASGFAYKKEENRATYKSRNPLFVHINGPDKLPIEEFL